MRHPCRFWNAPALAYHLFGCYDLHVILLARFRAGILVTPLIGGLCKLFIGTDDAMYSYIYCEAEL